MKDCPRCSYWGRKIPNKMSRYDVVCADCANDEMQEQEANAEAFMGNWGDDE